jgi:hypothetical protein
MPERSGSGDLQPIQTGHAIPPDSFEILKVFLRLISGQLILWFGTQFRHKAHVTLLCSIYPGLERTLQIITYNRCELLALLLAAEPALKLVGTLKGIGCGLWIYRANRPWWLGVDGQIQQHIRRDDLVLPSLLSNSNDFTDIVKT